MLNFAADLKKLIEFSQSNASQSSLKNEYLKLVKIYHPDANKDIDSNTANEYMISLNYVYELLITKKTINLHVQDEYEENWENGRYWFINDLGVKEYVKDKALYIYKLGLLEYQKCSYVMFGNSVFEGKGNDSGYEVVKHLYRCAVLARKAIEMDKGGIYANMAKELLGKAYKMNERITRGLKTSSEKNIRAVL